MIHVLQLGEQVCRLALPLERVRCAEGLRPKGRAQELEVAVCMPSEPREQVVGTLAFLGGWDDLAFGRRKLQPNPRHAVPELVAEGRHGSGCAARDAIVQVKHAQFELPWELSADSNAGSQYVFMDREAEESWA